MSKEENITIFEDTVNTYRYDMELVEAIAKQNQYTQVIPEGKEVNITIQENSSKGNVIITKSKTFDAARRYTDGKTAVLNFASATTPGGGVVKGSTAQEECLCRCSTLYPTLAGQRCYNEFYAPHRAGLDSIHNDDIIWTPDVVVFKSDDYKKLDRKDWKRISVISCAAPNLREKNISAYNIDKPLSKTISNKELHNIHLKRARRIFTVAIKKGVKNLILGAFGCGAFRNDPETVAKAWKKITDEFINYGMNIEYAIYDGEHSNNYEVFKGIFES